MGGKNGSASICKIVKEINPQVVDVEYKKRDPQFASLFFSGAKESRTPDLLHAMQALYQLSYNPERCAK